LNNDAPNGTKLLTVLQIVWLMNTKQVLILQTA